MRLGTRFQQGETAAEFSLHAHGIVLDDRQTATLFRTTRREGADDELSAGFEGTLQHGVVTHTVNRLREEMKYGAIVP